MIIELEFMSKCATYLKHGELGVGGLVLHQSHLGGLLGGVLPLVLADGLGVALDGLVHLELKFQGKDMRNSFHSLRSSVSLVRQVGGLEDEDERERSVVVAHPHGRLQALLDGRGEFCVEAGGVRGLVGDNALVSVDFLPLCHLSFLSNVNKSLSEIRVISER